MHGVITYKGLPAPLICDYLGRVASRQLYAEGTEFRNLKLLRLQADPQSLPTASRYSPGVIPVEARNWRQKAA